MKEISPIPIEVTPKLKRAYADALQMLGNAIKHGVARKYLHCAALYNIGKHGLHHASGLTWKEFVEQQGLGLSWADSQYQAGEALANLCMYLQPSLKSNDFLFSHQIIDTVLIARFPDVRNIDIKAIAKLRSDAQQLENWLDDAKLFSVSEAVKLLGPKPKHDELPPAKPVPGDDLFSSYDNLIAKGYTYDKLKRRFVNKDGSEITDEQLGECVVEEDAFRLFEHMHSIIEESKLKIADAHEMYARMHRAYMIMHPSAKPKADEEHNEIMLEVTQLRAIALDYFSQD